MVAYFCHWTFIPVPPSVALHLNAHTLTSHTSRSSSPALPFKLSLTRSSHLCITSLHPPLLFRPPPHFLSSPPPTPTSSMPPHPIFAPQQTTLITGAASGIGLAFAKRCHSLGMKVALVDINSSALASAQTSILESKTFGNLWAAVKTYTVDVSKLEDWRDLKAKVEMDFGLVGLLMLNAGISGKGGGSGAGWEDSGNFHTVMETNYFGTLYGISTFLPSLRSLPSSSPSTIIITGSKQGITNPPGNPAYNASKSAIKTLAEHLSYDLRDTTTDVFLLVPGWTYTGLTKQSGHSEKPEKAWRPEQVVEYLEGKMGEGKFYVICPDGDVSEGEDRNRMKWGVGDIVEGRPPLSRWREGYKHDARKWMKEQEGEGKRDKKEPDWARGRINYD